MKAGGREQVARARPAQGGLTHAQRIEGAEPCTSKGAGFKYFVGIDSLAKVATREDRVCVLNILGGESSDVTPVSHAFSGGNVASAPRPAAAAS